MINTRKKPHCRSCSSPMEGHRRNECPGTLGTFLKTPTPSPARASSQRVSPFRNSSLQAEEQDRKPSRLPALLADQELDAREFDCPTPMASIYASSDVSPSEIMRACENSWGKYHAGLFYTPNTTAKDKTTNLKDENQYKGWVIVGQDADLVKRVVRGGRDKPPGAFWNGMEVEIVEGPRMVTVPQLVFLACVAAGLMWYGLSVI